MSKRKSPDIPAPPSFQADPYYAPSQQDLTSQYRMLFSGLTGSGLPGLLGETVQTNPEITGLTLQRLQAQLEPSLRLSRQNLINTLEANNQLTGSTTASSLQNLENDYLSQLTAAGAEAGIADINRALQNRVNLYGMGLNTAQAVGGAGLQNQNQMNQFAVQNYENQVAAVLASQPQQRGGFLGGLTGGLGGALIGGALALPTGGLSVAAGAGLGALAGGGLGYFGYPGTGGQFLGAGATLAGTRGLGQVNNPYQIYNPQSGESINNLLYQPTNRLSSLSQYYPY